METQWQHGESVREEDLVSRTYDLLESTGGDHQKREVPSVTAMSVGCAIQILGGWEEESSGDWGSGLGYIRPIFNHNYHQKTKACPRKMTAKEDRLYCQTSFHSQLT